MLEDTAYVRHVYRGAQALNHVRKLPSRAIGRVVAGGINGINRGTRYLLRETGTMSRLARAQQRIVRASPDALGGVRDRYYRVVARNFYKADLADLNEAQLTRAGRLLHADQQRAARLLRRMDADDQRAFLDSNLADDVQDNLYDAWRRSPDVSARDVGAAVRRFDALDADDSARFRAILENPDLRSSWVRIVGQERIGSADIRFAFDSVDEVDGFSETQGFVTASRVNRGFPDDWNDPYTPGTIVVRAETTSTRDFVRLHRDGNQAGGFIAKREQVEGLSSSELRDKFSLSYEPTYVSDVEVPEGTTIRVGQVNSNFGGSAGAIQYELVDDLPPGSFTNQRELPI